MAHSRAQIGLTDFQSLNASERLASRPCHPLPAYRPSRETDLLHTQHNMSVEDSRDLNDGVNDLNDGFGRLHTDDQPKTDEDYTQANLTLRAIVTSKEAGVIIGKAGKNVADLRDETGVRAGVSKVVPGVHDRVMTVTGSLDGIAKAYGIVAKGLLDGAPSLGMGGIPPTSGTHSEFRSETGPSPAYSKAAQEPEYVRS